MKVYVGEAVHKGESHPGEHDAIVSRDLWDKVHAVLQERPRTRASKTRTQTPALLKGLIVGPTGHAMVPTHTRKGGRLYRYYVSTAILKKSRDACPIGRVPAGDIEAAVVGQIRGLRVSPEIVVATWKACQAEDATVTEASVRDALHRFNDLWDELFPDEQARIVQLLFERIELTETGMDLRLRTNGTKCLVQDLTAKAQAVPGDGANGIRRAA